MLTLTDSLMSCPLGRLLSLGHDIKLRPGVLYTSATITQVNQELHYNQIQAGR